MQLMKRLWMLSILAGWVFTSGEARAQPETLDVAMTKLANGVKKYLDDKKESIISVGQFKGPPGLPNSNGLAIQRTLTTKLTEMKFKVEPGGREISGRYRVSTSTGSSPVVLINATMITRNGDEDHAFVAKFIGAPEAAVVDEGKKVEVRVAAEEDVSKVVANTADLTTGVPAGTNADPQKTLQERDQRQIQSIEKPATSIQPSAPPQPPAAGGSPPPAAGASPPAATDPTGGNAPPPKVAAANQLNGVAVNSVISATPASPYRIEILVKNKLTGEFVPQPAVDKNGLAFTTLGFADEYAVRIINDANHDVGVKLFIDTLSMFEFTKIEPYRKLQMVWIGAKSSGVVTGWHIDNDQSAAFEVMELPKSAAFAKSVQEGDIGTISAQFFPSWPEGQMPPDVELAGKGRAANNLIGTGIGKAIQKRYENRIAQFGETLLATVSVRYQVPDDLPPPN